MIRIGTNQDVIKAYLNKSEEEGQSSTGNLFFEGDILYSYGYHFPLAIRVGSLYILNGDRYSCTTTTKHQSPLFNLVDNAQRVEIPFSALQAMLATQNKPTWNQREVALLCKKFRIIDWAPDRYVDTGRLDKWGQKIFDHVLGGVLFEFNKTYYVTGMDETGRDPRGMFFLTALKPTSYQYAGPPETWDAAIEMLKPQAVRNAEAQGREVHRQGEWFFVKVGAWVSPDSVEKGYKLQHKASKEPSHFASEGCSLKVGLDRRPRQFVRGIVKHADREHKQLKLYEIGTKPKDRPWFQAFESIQGESWKASGAVD